MEINPMQSQISFITRSFDPDHQIILNLADSVVNIDNELLKILGINQVNTSKELFDPTFYDLLRQNPLNSMDFISILRHNVQINNPCFLALSANVSILSRLAVPYIYLYIIVPCLIEDRKVLNVYNILTVARKLHDLFSSGFFTKPITNLGNNLNKRSVYFAFEALKSFACFTQPKHFTPTSDTGIFVADLLKFFVCKSNQKDDKLYRLKLFKSDGYIEKNQYKYSLQLSEQITQKVKAIPAIAFNALTQNVIVGL